MIKDEFFSNLPTDLFGRLETDGIAIVDDAIDGTLLKSVVQDSAKLEKNMKLGEISTGLNTDDGRRKARGDKILFLPKVQIGTGSSTLTLNNDVKTVPLSIGRLQQKFEHLRRHVNQYLQCNQQCKTDSSSFMLAMYPGDGTGYVKHKDSTGNKPGRKITAICYLNIGYLDEHGGHLQVWPRDKSNLKKTTLRQDGVEFNNGIIKVAPIGGRLVIFHSNLWHEVMPAYHRRIALTAWFVNGEHLKQEIISEEREKQVANLLKRVALRKLLSGDKLTGQKLTVLRSAENVENIITKNRGQLQLIYLDTKGTAESIRMVLRHGKIPFVDKRVSYEEIQNMRARGRLPTGQVPMLEIRRSISDTNSMNDECICITQSRAILRYCGKITKMYPLDDFLAAAKCDMVLDALDDIKSKLCPKWYGHVLGRSPKDGSLLIPLTKDQNDKVVKALNTDVLPLQFARLENILSESTGPFFCGDNMQICDVEASVVITGIMDGTYVGKDISPLVLRDCTKLMRLAKSVIMLMC